MKIKIIMNSKMYKNLLDLQRIICEYIARMNEPEGMLIRTIISILTPDIGIVLYSLMSKWMII